ncbi:DUF721 domain-containing protein [Trichlorobacter ammonificans]|uniref:DUF721 domain-containing protein n=1 Tax=Trichlorobacter ammonificans TaxID=2916410 RepID=A0ABM9D8Q5_9BACT|nr:DUF721 domain-containing protein [Trichlorobacter ammonificans]CAH2031593.1 conserved protein of unknown function [Trichlorobacter ammonificans]
MAGKRRKGSPEAIGRLISVGLEGSALGTRLKELEVWRVWKQAVGAAIAARTRPLRLSGGRLTVLVSGAPWMQQLNFLKEELRDKLNRSLGSDRVTEIIFKAGRIHEPPEEEQAVAPLLHPLSPARQRRIEQQVNELDDPELASLLKRLMELHYQRRPDTFTPDA